MAENETDLQAPAEVVTPATEHAVTTDGAQPIETILEDLAEGGAVDEPQPAAGQSKTGEVLEPLGAVTNRP